MHSYTSAGLHVNIHAYIHISPAYIPIYYSTYLPHIIRLNALKYVVAGI